MFERIDIIEKRFAKNSLINALIVGSILGLAIIGSVGIPLYLHFANLI